MPSDTRRGKNEDAGAVMAVAALNAPLLEELSRSQLDMHWEQVPWESRAATATSQTEWSQKEWDQWHVEKAGMTTCATSGAPMTPVVDIVPPAKAAPYVNTVFPNYEAAHGRCGHGFPHAEKPQAASGFACKFGKR